MWVTALIGMSLAFAEGSLAIRFREKGPDGHFRGGPMNYIRNGLGKKWGWLAVVFCIGLVIYLLYGYRKSHLGRGVFQVPELDPDAPPGPVPPMPGAPSPTDDHRD